MINPNLSSQSKQEASPKKTWSTPEILLMTSSSVNAGRNHGNYEGRYSNGKGGPANSGVSASFYFYIHS